MKFDIKTSNGKKLQFKVNGTKAILGRSVKCDVVIPEEALSRQHCQIELKNGSFFITDLGSSNGVFLDGIRIEAHSETAFAGFNSLTLGSLVECHVEDDEGTSSFQKNDIPHSASTPPQRNKIEKTSEVERPTKRLNRDAINKPLVMKNETTKPANRKINPGMLLALVGLLGLGFFFLTSEEEPVIEEAVVIKKPKRNRVRNQHTANQFKTTVQYSELKTKGNCAAYQFYCDNLKVDGKYLETIYNESLSYIVYLNPQRWLEYPQFSSIKTATYNLDLVALKLLIDSNLMQEYYSKRVNEIHLVIIDQLGTPKKAYRFHPSVMNPDVIPKLEIESAIGDAISKGSAGGFMDKIRPIIPSTELN